MEEHLTRAKELKARAKELETLLKSTSSHEERSRLQKEIEATNAQIRQLRSDAELDKSIAQELRTFFLDD